VQAELLKNVVPFKKGKAEPKLTQLTQVKASTEDDLPF
jgi:hypothetical protein